MDVHECACTDPHVHVSSDIIDMYSKTCASVCLHSTAIYVCTGVYTCTVVYTCTHVYRCVYLYGCVCLYRCVCLYKCVCLHRCVCLYCGCTGVHSNACTDTYCTYIYIVLSLYSYKCTWTCSCTRDVYSWLRRRVNPLADTENASFITYIILHCLNFTLASAKYYNYI